MAPNVTVEEEITQKSLDLQKLALTKGNYLVFPEKKYPEIEVFEHENRGKRGDPKKASLFDNASKVFDLTPHIGTEIHGLQLSQLTEQQKDDLALLVAERGVLVFRDQDINVDEGLDFARSFGPLHIHATFGHPPGYPEIHTVYFDTKLVHFLDGWHSDVSYEKQPAGVTLLKMDIVPEVGGDTLWHSGYAAYDRLSKPLQKFLEGLKAVHSGQDQLDEATRFGRTIRRQHVEQAHPIVRVHPVTGWKSLYVQPVFTRRIEGLRKHESDAILKLLYEHINGGYDFTVRVKWETNTVVVWDNTVTSHNAIFDYLDVGTRHGWRATSQAEAPYFDPNGKSKAEADAEAKN
ncbi:TauD-domain-containing protein [Hesseltinella vesiculosa]|uniref:TauD-domain-containing protein n=1 Tax=Hesseltinella vesiculosa TaxID=101127 RepID=A0A1X2G6A8_9FUNG|nr:TauD-domain-containing protein [Hesseltinella vesiculosa]